jgi:hypothetical protein
MATVCQRSGLLLIEDDPNAQSAAHHNVQRSVDNSRAVLVGRPRSAASLLRSIPKPAKSIFCETVESWRGLETWLLA